jgi:hypothetical protein
MRGLPWTRRGPSTDENFSELAADARRADAGVGCCFTVLTIGILRLPDPAATAIVRA